MLHKQFKVLWVVFPPLRLLVFEQFTFCEPQNSGTTLPADEYKVAHG